MLRNRRCTLTLSRRIWTNTADPVRNMQLYPTMFPRTRLPPHFPALRLEGRTDSEMAIPVLYVGGVGRSGSTLVERWIGECLSLATPGELDSIWAQGVISNEICGCGEKFSECEFWIQVGARAFGGWSRDLAEEMINLQNKYSRLRQLPRLVMNLMRPTLPEEVSLLVDRNYALLAAIKHESKCDGIVDGSKQFPRLVLLEHDPRLKCVPLHLVRQLKGVVGSWANPKTRPHSGTIRTQMRRRHAITVGCEWVVVNALFMLNHYRVRNAARLRFEDFLEKPDLAVDWLRGWVRDNTKAASSSPDELVLTRAHGMGGNSARFAHGSVKLLRRG